MYNKHMDWFTSDLHLGHKKMIEGHRGSTFSSIEEHDNILINNLLDSTNPGDNLYILGDIFWKYSAENIEEFFNKFKKNKVIIHWILGNHDRTKQINSKSLVYRGYMKDIKIQGQSITLCHYPMLTWNKSHYNAWQLFGHHHLDTHKHEDIREFELRSKRLNVCCEFHNYKPIEFNKVKDIMDNKRPDNWDLIKRNDKYGD